jgi:hypothetical protein
LVALAYKKQPNNAALTKMVSAALLLGLAIGSVLVVWVVANPTPLSSPRARFVSASIGTLFALAVPAVIVFAYLQGYASVVPFLAASYGVTALGIIFSYDRGMTWFRPGYHPWPHLFGPKSFYHRKFWRRLLKRFRS